MRQGRPREGDMRPLVAQGTGRPGPQGEVMKALEAWVDAHIARPELNMGYRQWERMWAGERQGGQEVGGRPGGGGRGGWGGRALAGGRRRHSPWCRGRVGRMEA